MKNLKQNTNDTMNLETLESKELVMSSRDIADLTGKRHPDVKRDVVNMLQELKIDASRFAHIYEDSRNREQIEYLLSKNLTLTLVSGYSIKLRSAIIERWQELEEQNQFTLPTTFADACRMLADESEKNQKLLGQVEDMTPKAVFHDRVTASDSVCQMAVACQVAKLPFGRNILYRKLRTDGVLISGNSRHNLPKQEYIDRGLFTVEENSYEHPKTNQTVISFTTHVTQKGVDWLIKQFGEPEKEAA